jgi:hypothetical protein
VHLWSVAKVLGALRRGLSDQENARYFLAFFALVIVGLNLPIDSDARGWLGRDGFLKWVIYCAIAFAGAAAAYAANRKGDRQEFAPRFIALFVPLTVQSLLVVALGLAAAAFIPDRLPESTLNFLNASRFWDWYWFCLQVLAESLLFVRIATNMHRASVPHGVT